jgi:hypothetical protein
MTMALFREHLTEAELEEIAERYAPYHTMEAFWTGFADYQEHRECPKGWVDARGQAWDRGAEAAMNVRIARVRERQ